MEQIKEYIEYFTEIETWFNSAGPGVKTMGSCILLGYFFKAAFAKAPSPTLKRWAIFMIPFLVLTASAVLFSWYGNTGSVDPGIEHPVEALAVNGLFYGLAAWALHAFVLSRFIDSWAFPKDSQGNTQLFYKPKTESPIAGDSE